VTSNEKKYE
jgi:hypothetical protein